ncbi:hypothetical protein [Microbulbifer sp. SSSA005]|uniref:hypothetical protein n=1 Tax=unclassified Microbulbifer TaxID=2619833 RepID=UPI00403B08FE
MMYKKKLLILLCFLVPSMGLASGDGEKFNNGYVVNNLADDFYDLYNSSEGMDDEARAFLIAKELSDRFPEYYKDGGEIEEGGKYSLKNRVFSAVSNFPDIEIKYLSKERSLNISLEDNLKSFSNTFSDMAMDVPIYMLHSFGEFNGTYRKLDGQGYLMFGLDMMAEYHSWEVDSSFFHHELFHVYHEKYFSGCEQLWCDIWTEGLATYISHELNPSADYNELMLNIPAGMVPDIDARLLFALNDLKVKFHSEDPAIKSSFNNFAADDTGLPVRRGYYLGYILSKSLGEKYSYVELARMSNGQVERLLLSELNKLIQAYSS